MRKLVCLAALAAATLSQAGTLPAGTFTGTAEWLGPHGSTGTYTVERTFEGNTMRSRFAWNEAKPRSEEHAVTFALGKAPSFEVKDAQGQVVGKGHCVEDTCAYAAEFGKIHVEETLRFAGDSLTVVGTKSGPGFSVVWKEALKR